MTGPIHVVEVLEATAGGTRRHLSEVVDALSTPEFRLHLVCAVRRDPSFERELDAWRRRGHSVSVLPMTRSPHPLRDPFCALRLRAILRRSPCDVVHLHSAKAGWLGRLAASGLDLRVLYTPHAFPFVQRVSALPRLGYRAAERLCAPLTDTLLAVSDAEGELAVASGLFPRERVRVLPNAVDLDAFERRVGALPPIAPPAGPRCFGLVGELRRQKDPETFLGAARRVRERGIPARFLLPDQGGDRRRIERRVDELGLAPVVEWVGTRDSLEPLYRKIDVGVLPSLWEGLPYAALDVFAAQRPLLASELPVFASLLGRVDRRLLFPAGDAEALADRMELWARLPTAELVETASRGRELVRKEHDAAAWREELCELIRRVANG